MTTPPTKQRLDQWLWRARFFKTRTLASTICRKGKIRIDSAPQRKAAASVVPGQVLTFPQAGAIRVVRILSLSWRRGPAVEAAALYEDLTPPQERLKTGLGQRRAPRGGRRPTKKDRRAIELLKADQVTT
ncbi:MAG: RNA-binding S4 domain-containing protein [Proteobacteria bacterium]|nr:RNA-binding S4 domain-containing protein [Pseudomonadota bacterium]